MARMSIDDSVARDPRITLLGSLLGLSRHETVGILVCEVWPICYDQRTHLISERMINAAAGRADFAERMIEAELATRDRSGRVSVTGAKERIRYLEQKSESGRQGGLKSAKARADKTKQTSSTTGSTPQASRNPPVPDSASASASAPDPVPSPVPEKNAAPPVAAEPLDFLSGFDRKHDDMVGPEPEWWGNEKPKAGPALRAPAKSRAPSGPHQEAVAAFHAYFQRTNGGSSPTWGPKAGKLVQGLLSKHGLPEYLRRLTLLESHPPSFPPPPWDLATFAQHFDRIAVVRRPKTATDIALAIANGETP